MECRLLGKLFSDYRVGDKDCGWSDLFWFRTFPEEGSDWSPRLAIFGDMGNVNAVSLPYLQAESQSGMYDVILHVGDFAYDMFNVNLQVIKNRTFSQV